MDDRRARLSTGDPFGNNLSHGHRDRRVELPTPAAIEDCLRPQALFSSPFAASASTVGWSESRPERCSMVDCNSQLLFAEGGHNLVAEQIDRAQAPFQRKIGH